VAAGVSRRFLNPSEPAFAAANCSGAKKTAPAHGEKGRQSASVLLIFPEPMMPGLELAPGVEIAFNRLPWCQRASPSTTLHETVVSTDTDKLISKDKIVNRILTPHFAGCDRLKTAHE